MKCDIILFEFDCESLIICFEKVLHWEHCQQGSNYIYILSFISADIRKRSESIASYKYAYMSRTIWYKRTVISQS